MMETPPPHVMLPPPRAGARFFGPEAVVCVCACAIAATAYTLGADWLGAMFLWMPVGVWLVAAACTATTLIRRSRDRFDESAYSGPVYARPVVLEPYSLAADSSVGGFSGRVPRSHTAQPEPEPESDESPRPSLRFNPSRERPVQPTPPEQDPEGLPEPIGELVFDSDTDTEDDAPADDKHDSLLSVRRRPDTNGVLRPSAVMNGSSRPTLGEQASSAFRAFAGVGSSADHSLVELSNRVTAWYSSRFSASHRLRIGVDLPGTEWAVLSHASRAMPGAEVPVEHHRIPAGLNDQADLRLHRLDALIRRGPDGVLRISLPQHPDRPSAWEDWSARPPLSYTSVFPLRMDPACVTLGCEPLGDPRDAAVTMGLAHAAALVGRAYARFGFMDRLRRRASGPGPIDGFDAASDVMLSLGHVLRWSLIDEPSGPMPAHRSAARALTAWFTSAARSVMPTERSAVVEAAYRIVPDEPEPALRLAAIRFADYQDQEGMRQLLLAQQMLRSNPEPLAIDPLAFIHAELQMPDGDPIAIGRIAAGICLLWATATPESLAYLRDDLFDELRYAGLLIGRDQDHRLLREIIAELEYDRFGVRPGRRLMDADNAGDATPSALKVDAA